MYHVYIYIYIYIYTLLNNPDVLDEINSPHGSSDGIMRDFCDAQLIKESELFKKDPTALQLIMFYDKIEVANPLGAKAGIHKLGELRICMHFCIGVFYYGLGNISLIFRSSLQVIQLACIARPRSVDITNYGLLKSFFEQVNCLVRCILAMHI